MSLLSDVALAPDDPILGMTETYNADTRSPKVNLGVGVYTDEDGKVPVLRCVAKADQAIVAANKPYGYLPISGLKTYDEAVGELVLGDAVPKDRVVVIQTLGGTGALRLVGDFLHDLNPAAKVLVSSPSWENHRALFTKSGFQVGSYPYYNAETRSIDFAGMLSALEATEPGTVVVLHACCHNPTGYDLTPDQWSQVLHVLKLNNLVPVLDMAYQGFAEGLDADSAAPRLFARAGIPTFITNSFSKTFSLYGERIGALTAVVSDAEEATRVMSQLKSLARVTYSNPPTHGATLVSSVLSDADLRADWEDELASMRDRIKDMRRGLRQGLEAARPGTDFSYITEQNGMFSYSGLSAEQMQRLRDEFAVYGLDSGRICMAAVSHKNLPYVVSSIAAVL